MSTLASGVLRDPHELLDKVADMPVVVPQPDKVVFVPVVQIVQVPQKLVVEVVEIPQLQLIEKIAAIPGVDGVVAAENCGSSAVAVRRRGRCLPCRCAEAVPHGLDCLVDHCGSTVAAH